MAEIKKTHWKKLHNPDYIGAYSLMEGEKAIEMDVQIKSVAVETVIGADGKKDQCTVAQLTGQKPFIINATNAKTITKIYGSPYVEDWIGKRITLFVAKVKVASETVDALRIRPTAPKGTKEAALPELTPTHEKWNGAKTALAAGNTTIEAIRNKYTLSAENEALLKPQAVTLDNLRDLLDIKRDAISLDKLKEANQIISDKDEAKYAVIYEFLKQA